MKIALCYSGQIGAIYKANPNQKRSFIDCNDPDIYCYTSDAVSQKDNIMLNMNRTQKCMSIYPVDTAGEKIIKHME
mgnify:CR=1 FL=1